MLSLAATLGLRSVFPRLDAFELLCFSLFDEGKQLLVNFCTEHTLEIVGLCMGICFQPHQHTRGKTEPKLPEVIFRRVPEAIGEYRINRKTDRLFSSRHE